MLEKIPVFKRTNNVMFKADTKMLGMQRNLESDRFIFTIRFPDKSKMYYFILCCEKLRHPGFNFTMHIVFEACKRFMDVNWDDKLLERVFRL